MSKEIKYDTASDTEVIRGHPEEKLDAEIQASEGSVEALSLIHI